MMRQRRRSHMRFQRITTDPDHMGGAPCIRGLQIPVVGFAFIWTADVLHLWEHWDRWLEVGRSASGDTRGR
ncbi:MAG: DUF433 domain-containing protein [Chloroflexi bacterium]|nr:DUF433 domain-containing protein [Chloroflexota bacterium]